MNDSRDDDVRARVDCSGQSGLFISLSSLSLSYYFSITSPHSRLIAQGCVFFSLSLSCSSVRVFLSGEPFVFEEKRRERR